MSSKNRRNGHSGWNHAKQRTAQSGGTMFVNWKRQFRFERARLWIAIALLLACCAVCGALFAQQPEPFSLTGERMIQP
jgi:hypothetical protein